MHPLFYQERGNFIRNYYCSECLCGPFLKEDIKKGLLIELGGERQVFYYCRKCYNTKHISVNIELMMLSKEESEREKYIISGQALEDLRSRLSKKEVRKIKIKEESPILVPVEKLPKAVVNNISEDIAVDEILAEGSNEIIEDIIKDTNENKIDPFFKYELKQGEINFLTMSAQAIIDLVKNKTGISILTPLKNKRLIITYAQKILGDKILYNKSILPPEAPISLKNKIEPEHNNIVDITSLSAKKIIDLVKEKVGQNIAISLKNKKTIIKRAKILLEEKGFYVQCEIKSEVKPEQIETHASVLLEPNQNKDSISNLSAKYIVNLVKEKTGQEITLSLKSKKSIVKLAGKILTEKGFSI
jgi:hypothetical protein